MPVITPSFPSMCSTFNVSESTKEVIYRELHRGSVITEKAMTGKGAWKDLFVKHTFFTQNYKYYLAIVSASTDREAQKAWGGRVESRVRFLITRLDQDGVVALAHPFNKGFSRVNKCANEEQIEDVKHGSVKYQIQETVMTDINHDPAIKGTLPNDTISASPEADEKNTIIYTETFYVGLELLEGK